MSEQSRWAVLYETSSVLGGAILGIKPLVEYRYFRWRWLAALDVWLTTFSPNPLGCWTTARLLGRVTTKPANP